MHAQMAHGDAVADSGYSEDKGCAACRVNAVLDRALKLA